MLTFSYQGGVVGWHGVGWGGEGEKRNFPVELRRDSERHTHSYDRRRRHAAEEKEKNRKTFAKRNDREERVKGRGIGKGAIDWMLKKFLSF
jgi:hypothetical protein